MNQLVPLIPGSRSLRRRRRLFDTIGLPGVLTGGGIAGARVENIDYLADGMMLVGVEGGGITGEYRMHSSQFEGGDRWYVQGRSVIEGPADGNGRPTFMPANDGFWMQMANPLPLHERARLVVHEDDLFPGRHIYAEVVGLSAREAAYSAVTIDYGEYDPWTYGTGRVAGDTRGVYRGFAAMHAYSTPGARVLTATIRYFRPDTGQLETFVLTQNIVVRDLDDRFAGRVTAYDPSGNFFGVPAGATQFTSWGQAYANHRAPQKGGRLAIASTADPILMVLNAYRLDDSRNEDTILIDTFGGPEHPVFNCADAGWKGNFGVTNDTVFRGVDFEGQYDPATGNGDRQAGIVAGAGAKVQLTTCRGANLESFLVISGQQDPFYGGPGVDLPVSPNGLFDCEAFACENYGTFINAMDLGGLVGNSIWHDPDNTVTGDEEKLLGQTNVEADGDGNHTDHGGARIASAGRFAISNNLGLTIGGWFEGNALPGADPGADAMTDHQSFLRLSSSVKHSRGIVSDNTVEGGFASMSGSSISSYETDGFIVVRTNWNIGTANQGGGLMAPGYTGVYWVCNVGITPDVPQESENPRRVAGSPDSHQPNPARGWLDAPVEVVGNTTIYLLSDANAINNRPFSEIRDLQFFEDYGHTLRDVGNLFHAPNITFVGDAGPRVVAGLLSDTQAGYLVRYLGQHLDRDDSQPSVIDAAYATPQSAALLGQFDDVTPVSGVTRGLDYPAYGLRSDGGDHPPIAGAFQTAEVASVATFAAPYVLSYGVGDAAVGRQALSVMKIAGDSLLDTGTRYFQIGSGGDRPSIQVASNNAIRIKNVSGLPNTNFAPAGPFDLAVMVAFDFDGGLEGGRTFDAWVNGARVGSSTAAIAGTVPLMNNYFAQFNLTSPFRGEVRGALWYHSGAVLDPAVHWTTFFDAENEMRDLGATGLAGGITPEFFLPVSTGFDGTNRGSLGDLAPSGTPPTVA